MIRVTPSHVCVSSVDSRVDAHFISTHCTKLFPLHLRVSESLPPGVCLDAYSSQGWISGYRLVESMRDTPPRIPERRHRQSVPKPRTSVWVRNSSPHHAYRWRDPVILLICHPCRSREGAKMRNPPRMARESDGRGQIEKVFGSEWRWRTAD